jgi:hypothetical protein
MHLDDEQIRREEAEIAALLRGLDSPAPAITAEQIANRASRRRPRIHRWAAGILLAVGIGGVAYAIPGSPLPRWAGAIASWIGRVQRHGLPPGGSGDAGSRVAGIAVAPGQRFSILFNAPRPGSVARVSLVEGAEVVIRASLGSATFTSGADQIVIDNKGAAATFEIQIPRAAPFVEIKVDGKQIFLKRGPRVVAPSEGMQGSYALPLGP